MASDLPLRCACGAVRGAAREVSAERGLRIVCYCDDCQAFARFLGRPSETLDGNGGTEIFQTTPARVAITEGADRLACLRLTEKGLLRWYAACCRTPLANTLPFRQVPFIGLVLPRAGAGARDASLGAVRGRLFGRFATGDLGGQAAPGRPPAALIARAVGMLLAARLRGEQRASPFFDARTGTPVAAPHVLDEAERRRARGA